MAMTLSLEQIARPGLEIAVQGLARIGRMGSDREQVNALRSRDAVETWLYRGVRHSLEPGGGSSEGRDVTSSSGGAEGWPRTSRTR